MRRFNYTYIIYIWTPGLSINFVVFLSISPFLFSFSIAPAADGGSWKVFKAANRLLAVVVFCSFYLFLEAEGGGRHQGQRVYGERVLSGLPFR